MRVHPVSGAPGQREGDHVNTPAPARIAEPPTDAPIEAVPAAQEPVFTLLSFNQLALPLGILPLAGGLLYMRLHRDSPK
ncbi:hypothetical protein CF326_g8715 [Tilletia indica]|nr:hypothetical protein CF326_g8715 [Tilletia indica]